MRIISVTKEIEDQFISMIPEGILEGRVWILACVDDTDEDSAEIVTVAVIGCNEPELELRYIYTDESQRNRGGCRMILEHLIKICDKHRFKISASWDMTDEYSNTLSFLCEGLGYETYADEIATMTVTRYEIENLPFCEKYSVKSIPGEKSLTELDGITLRNIVKDFKEFKDEFATCDMDISRIVYTDDVVKCLLLAERTENPEEIYVSFIYSKNAKDPVIIQFVRNAFGVLIDEYENINLVTFECINDELANGMSKILNRDFDPNQIGIIHAEYDARINDGSR